MSPIARGPQHPDPGVAARARRFGPLPYRELGWRAVPATAMTSEEVGRLLGPHLDRWWRAMGQSDPFVLIVEGPEGEQVVLGILAAAPVCAPALRVVLVQPDGVARARIANMLQLEPAELALGPLAPSEGPDDEAEFVPGRGPLVASLATAPEVGSASVLLAVGLLSRLPADVMEWRDGQWFEVRRGAGFGDDLVDMLVAPAAPATLPLPTGPLTPLPTGPLTPLPTGPLAAVLEPGWRAPLTQAATDWLADARARSPEGLVAVADLVVPRTVDLAGPSPRPGVALDQIDPGGTGRRGDDEALSPLRLIEWGDVATSSRSQRRQ